MRKNRKSSRTVTDATAQAEAAPIKDPGSAGAGGTSAYSAPLSQSQLLVPESVGLVPSPYGEAYLSRRSRPIPADAIQAMSDMWFFDIRGYYASGVTTAGQINEYNAGETLILDWYNYARQKGKAALKYKHTPVSLLDTGNVREYLNICFYAIANLSVLFNLNRLYQYNQAFSTLYSYLPDKVSRATRLWRRLSTVFMPSVLKMYAMKCGMIPYIPGVLPPWIRFWDSFPLTVYGGASDYTGMLTEFPDTIVMDNTHLTNLLDDIEKAVWALEGNISDANTQADFIAIKDAIDMLNDVQAGLFTQGLPEPSSFPGLMADKSLFNDLLCRGVFTKDTHGLGVAKMLAFPVSSYSDLNSRVPVVGFGTPGIEEFTLLGAPKCFTLNSAAGTIECGTADEYIAFGTNHKLPMDTNTMHMYTREEGVAGGAWNISQDAGNIDFEADLKTLLNSGHAMRWHAFFPALVSSQLGASFELRFLDSINADYQVYVDDADFGPHYAMLLGSMLGVPYLK